MNKYKLLILICFFLLTISLPNVTASINNLNLLGKIIVLDAGHGGTDSGAKNGKIVESFSRIFSNLPEILITVKPRNGFRHKPAYFSRISRSPPAGASYFRERC